MRRALPQRAADHCKYMTSGAGARRWTCALCTNENAAEELSCGLCGSPVVDGSTGVFRPAPLPRAWVCRKCTLRHVGGAAGSADECTACGAPRAADFWVCSRCTLVNGAPAPRCGSCGGPSSRGAPPVPALDRASSSVGGVTAPDFLLCGITRTLMRDPVITLSGHSYERATLEAFVAAHGREPLTGARMRADDGTARPNVGLRYAVDEFLARSGAGGR